MTTQANVLTRDAIMKSVDYTVEEVNVPKWGGTVRLRSLTGKGRDEFEAAVTKSSGTPGQVDIRGLKALLLTMTIVDSDDQLVFTKDDVDLINEKSSDVIESLWEVVQKMNGIGEEGLEETEKNSASEVSDSSGSDSLDS